MKFKSVPKGLLNFSFLSLKFSVFIFTPAGGVLDGPLFPLYIFLFFCYNRKNFYSR